MSTRKTFPYNPDYCVVPGETLTEMLDAKGMTQRELAKHMDVNEAVVSHIVHGNRGITADHAITFEQLFGVPAEFWMRLEMHYRLFKARKKRRDNVR